MFWFGFFGMRLLYLSFSSHVILFSPTTTITVSKGVLVSWFKFKHFTPNPASNEITGKTLTDFTGNETNWRSKAPMRGVHHCHSHPAEFVRTRTRYYLKALNLCFTWHSTSLLFCKIVGKVFFNYLQATNQRGWVSHWRQFWASLARRLPVSGKVHPVLPFLQHSRSQNNAAVLNIAPPCSFNRLWFLQCVQATTFVKIRASIWDVILT